ncbi:uncharacterized protein N7518_002784 [Penicillium psychrosexuale]|uniref:uncharacterized protein n=1 Tax=Penicillium psychrosexuale TaxID=1002107 RepID=UPI002544F6F5|nr:uncharacterized protein N7518_002784 [Penicillium psychrosexuale]KAJ5800716.1 hypothetical protein N7518_002784 [Penicillium psychrosexuale]
MISKEVSYLFGVSNRVLGNPRNGRNILFVGYIVLDELKNKDTISIFGGSYIKLKYLYFCFIVAYLNVKSRGAGNAVAKKVEATRFWPSAGEYLNRSILVTLARYKTFDSGDTSTRDADAGTVLGADVRDAILAMKSL